MGTTAVLVGLIALVTIIICNIIRAKKKGGCANGCATCPYSKKCNNQNKKR